LTPKNVRRNDGERTLRKGGAKGMGEKIIKRKVQAFRGRRIVRSHLGEKN